VALTASTFAGPGGKDLERKNQKKKIKAQFNPTQLAAKPPKRSVRFSTTQPEVTETVEKQKPFKGVSIVEEEDEDLQSPAEEYTTIYADQEETEDEPTTGRRESEATDADEGGDGDDADDKSADGDDDDDPATLVYS